MGEPKLEVGSLSNLSGEIFSSPDGAEQLALASAYAERLSLTATRQSDHSIVFQNTSGVRYCVAQSSTQDQLEPRFKDAGGKHGALATFGFGDDVDIHRVVQEIERLARI
jgi:hypothetical protein